MSGTENTPFSFNQGYIEMSDSKNNLPIIIGVVALLIAVGAGGFLVSKNMKKETALATATESAATAEPAANEKSAANRAGEPAATPEEVEEVTKSAANGFNGTEVKP
ncbi:MAG: hypothetical protein DI551_10230, partial [Micavibrio aeruginosavorus]